MTLPEKKLNSFLFALEGVGGVFVIIFLAAYLGGIPTTNVLQDQPAFRIPLQVFGVSLLILIFVGVLLAIRYRK